MKLPTIAAPLLLLLGSALSVAAQAPASAAPSPNMDVRSMPLWTGQAPGALGDTDADRPTLTFFPARQPNSTAVIVMPGGGYGGLAMNHEGRQVASWLNGLGINAFVLQYRLGPRYKHPVELGDAQRAIRLVRARAAEFGVAPDRIGILGFSAGGHLASTAGTHFDAGNPSAPDPVDAAGSRPDFMILGYPVITMDAAFTHAGSRRNLLGDPADPLLVEDLSNELRVTPQTPPTFLFHTTNDPTVPVMNSVVFYQALVKAGVPAELHVFASGPHGVGLAFYDPALSAWPTLLSNWLRARGLLDASAASRPPAPR